MTYASPPPRAAYEHAPQRKDKTDAGVALGLSFLPCCITNVIGAVLAVRILTRSRYTTIEGPALGMAIAALCVSAAWILVGIGLLFADLADEAEEGPKTAQELQVGDCFNVQGDVTEIRDVPALSCDKPHDAEVYWITELEGRGYPGDRVVDRLARTACLDHFEQYVGVPVRESSLTFYYLVPTPESWLWDDTEVVCAVVDSTGPRLSQTRQVTGTLRGSNR